MRQLTCSIVLYNTDEILLQKAIDSVLQSDVSVKLYLVDNSETDSLQKFADRPSVEYIFNNKNIGFGNGHNIAINRAIDQSDYHLVINPDITFQEGVLENILAFMEKNKSVGQLMPKVFYENGDLQRLCNLLPTPFELINRRFLPSNNWTKKINEHYELRGFDYNTCANIPNLSGCFMFLRSAVLQKTGGFDKRFFMYVEDVDLTRRIHKIAQTLYYPHVGIYHRFEKESYSNPVLLRHHINSAIKYFNKWGWFFDAERKRINDETLKQLKLI